MSFSRNELEELVKLIRDEQEKDSQEQLGQELILELAHPQHCRMVAEYVRTIQFFDSYCRLEIVPEPLTSYIEIERNELLLPYTSILAIEKRRYGSDQKEDRYCNYRLITSEGLGYFYDLDGGYVIQKDETDPHHIQSPSITLSKIYGILKKAHTE